MNSRPTPLFSACLLMLSLGLTACKPKPSGRFIIHELEQREDGRSYAIGSETPYTGEFIRLGKSGTKIEEMHLKDGLLHGPFFTWTKDGHLKRRTDFLNGAKTRKQVWYLNGQMKADETWSGDTILGRCTYWFEDGRIRKQVTLAAGFKAEGHVLEYGEDGSVLIDAICHEGLLVSGKCAPGMEGKLSNRYSADDATIKKAEEDLAQLESATELAVNTAQP